MDADRLIQGHPYHYLGADGHSGKMQVLYDRTVYLPDGTLAYHFRFRREVKAGFVNLTADQVKHLIVN